MQLPSIAQTHTRHCIGALRFSGTIRIPRCAQSISHSNHHPLVFGFVWVWEPCLWPSLQALYRRYNCAIHRRSFGGPCLHCFFFLILIRDTHIRICGVKNEEEKDSSRSSRRHHSAKRFACDCVCVCPFKTRARWSQISDSIAHTLGTQRGNIRVRALNRCCTIVCASVCLP